MGVAFWIAVLVALVLYGLIGTRLFYLSTLGTVFMYIVLTQAWNILGGYGGYLNFGMATFFGTGAYASAILFHYFGLSPFLTAPLAGLAAAIAGLLIGIPTLRLRGAYFALVTMIITFAVQILVLNLPWTQGALGIYMQPIGLTPLGVERLFYFLFLGLAAAVTALVYAIERSNMGWALVAIREDEDAAEIVGVKTILMAVIGGAGAWQGPLIGAPVVLLVADTLRVTFTSEVNRAIFSIVVIVIALFVPGGVMGLIHRWRRKKRVEVNAAPEKN